MSANALPESERYRLATSTGEIWDTDFASGVSFISPRLKDRLGYAPHEVPDTAEGWLALVHPDDRPGAVQALMQHLKQRVPFDVEYRVRTKAGGWRWLHSRGQAAWDERTGRATHMAGTLIDIDDRKRAEQRARRLSDANAALSRMNRAIARRAEPAALYEEFCRVCVEHGLAHRAQVRLRDAAGEAVAAQAGTCAPAPASALRLPVRRGGDVVGEVLLQADEAAFFDDALQGVLDTLVADLSFALDNADREAARLDAVRRAEAALHRFGSLFHGANLAMAVSRLADGCLFEVNDAYCTLIGLPRVALVGRTTVELGVFDAEQRALLVQQLRRDGEVRDLEMEVAPPSRGRRVILINARVVDLDGEPGLLTICNDLTERRRLDAALRDSMQALAEREAQLAGIVETAQDAIVTVDAQRICRVFNRAAAALFKLPQAEAIGQPLARFIPPRLQAGYFELIDRIAAGTANAASASPLLQFVGLTADGEEVPLEGSISRQGEGERLLVTVLARDVTEQRRVEAARRAQLAAEAASRAKTEFLSRMSHELRTPLNAVLGFAQLLQLPGAAALTPQQHDNVEQIRRAGWHLLGLITDVLDVSRIEAGVLAVEQQLLDVHAVLDEALRMTQPLATARGVTLHTQHPNAPLRAWGDATRLRQVFINVLSNAVKYNRAGGSVRVLAYADGDAVRVDIVDTGLGMTREQLEHLYEPFNRLGRERSGIEGTGIGLVLTRQLVLLMHGRLDIDSSPGQGTSVTLRLPSDAAHPPVVPAPAAAPTAEVASPGGLVLHIEDNPLNHAVVAQLIARWPQVRLAHAEDGRRGIALARMLQPDLVLLDMRLPDMDGTHVLQALRADDATRALPVVALSANAMPEDIASARGAGALDYWTKPLDIERFMAELPRWLRR